MTIKMAAELFQAFDESRLEQRFQSKGNALCVTFQAVCGTRFVFIVQDSSKHQLSLLCHTICIPSSFCEHVSEQVITCVKLDKRKSSSFAETSKQGSFVKD